MMCINKKIILNNICISKPQKKKKKRLLFLVYVFYSYCMYYNNIVRILLLCNMTITSLNTL